MTAPVGSRRAPAGRLGIAATALTGVAVFVLGALVYLLGLSRLSEAHAQADLARSFRYDLGQAVAPVGPTTAGKPVAALDIPAIGLHNVIVVEGTSARQLTDGPGHRRDTPLPGQGGVSVLYGRRTLFGAPFQRVPSLRPGDQIVAITGQGDAHYTVVAPGTAAVDALQLVTADSSFAPHSSTVVTAVLTSPVQPAGSPRPAVTTEEQALSGAPSTSLVPLVLWAQALLVGSVLATVAAHRWARGPAWVCLTPVMLAVLWNVYENAATLLPNLL